MEPRRCEECGGKFIGDECPHCAASAEEVDVAAEIAKIEEAAAE